MNAGKSVKSGWGRLILIAGVVIWMSFLATAPLQAQSTGWGTIIGRVTDQSGAVIPNVEVKLRNEATNVTATAVSNATGDYAFTNVIPGTYQLSFMAKGFKPYDVNHLVMYVSQTVRQDAPLTLGAVAQTVEVTSALPLVQTSTSEVGSVVDSKQIMMMPLNGRTNLWGMLALAPGVQLAGSNARIGGATWRDGTSETMDGIEFMEQENERLADLSPSLDAIAEFKVVESSGSAENGVGTVQIITASKSGTDKFHGTAFEYNRIRALSAANFFSTAIPKGQFIRNEFGGSLGGPIKRDKLFFFGSYESWMYHSNSTAVSAQPTTALLQGNFTGLATITDPTTGQPFPNNQIPTGRISSISSQFFKYFLTPNTQTTAAGGLGNNFTGVIPISQNRKRPSVRVDYNINTKNALSVRYFYVDQAPYTTAGSTPLMGGTIRPNTSHSLAVNYTSTITPSIANVATFGYSREWDKIQPQNYSFDPCTVIAGLPCSLPTLGGLPTMAITGFTGLSDTVGSVDRVHAGPRDLLPDRQRDRARPGAEVGHHGPRHVHLAQPGDRPAGHDLGLGARDEHAGSDVELQVAEVRVPGDVLQRLARGAARDVGPEPRVEVGVGDGVQLAAPDVVHAGRDQLGVRARRFHPGLGQPRRGQGHLIKQQAHRRRKPRTPGGQLRGQVRGGQRVDHRVEVSVDDLVEVVGLVADPVIGDPVLREVVGAHALRPVHGADLAAPLRAGLRVGVGLGLRQQPRAQHAQGLLLVLQLALLVLAGHHDPGRQVGDPHRRVGRVHALPAGPGGPEHVDLDVVVVDLDLDRLGLGRDEHAGRRGVDPPLRLGDGHPLHAVHPALVLQPGPGALGALALHRHGRVLDPAQAGDGGIQDLGLPAAAFGVTLVHPQQVPGEQRGLLAALARLDLQDDVAIVVRVPRQTGSASGATNTPAAEVWIRPCDSVTGTRCTRFTPPSYFSLDQAPSAPLPFTTTVASLIPPRPVTVESRISVFQPRRSAYRWYIRSRSPANSADSSPPSPALTSRMMSRSSFGSRGTSSLRSRSSSSSRRSASSSASAAMEESSLANSCATCSSPEICCHSW